MYAPPDSTADVDVLASRGRFGSDDTVLRSSRTRFSSMSPFDEMLDEAKEAKWRLKLNLNRLCASLRG